MSSSPAPPAAEAVSIPLEARIRLGHAVVQAIADDEGVDILHIKGYAVAPGLYPEGRQSTDIDIFVRPRHARRFLEALRRHAWQHRTTFRSGSIFDHAAVAWHDTWGYVDVHRVLPGVGISADAAFDRMWASRGTASIAGLPCVVPSRRHQVFIVILHDARESGDTTREVEHLRAMSTVEQREWYRAEARAFNAEIAWAAASGHLDEFREHPQWALWDAIRRGAGRAELLRARIRSASSPMAKLGLVLGAAVPNRDHLRMSLGHEPTMADYWRDTGARVTAARGVLRQRLGGSGGGDRR